MLGTHGKSILWKLKYGATEIDDDDDDDDENKQTEDDGEEILR